MNFLNSTIGKLSKFFFGGLFNFAIKLGLTYILTEYLKLWYFTSYIITLSLLLLFGFFYNAYITFKVVDNKRKNFVKFAIIMFSFSVLDGIVVKIVTDALGVYYIASILIVTMVLFVLRFMAYQKVVFINKNERSQINGIISPLLQKIRINQAKRFMKGNSFLDVGSSLGEIIRILPKKAIYVGIEGNKDFFINAKNKNPNHKFINLYLNKNNVKNLKIKEKFDTIFALAVVEHMNDPEQIISGLKKYLKPEGRIIITTPSKWSELILNLGSKLGIFMEEMGEHKKQFTKEEIIKLGISAGYSIEHYKSFELGMNHLLVLKKK